MFILIWIFVQKGWRVSSGHSELLGTSVDFGTEAGALLSQFEQDDRRNPTRWGLRCMP